MMQTLVLANYQAILILNCNSDKMHSFNTRAEVILSIIKKILIATYFSDRATHTAEYGYLSTKQLKAGVFLCNAIVIPAEVPVSGIVFEAKG